MKKISNIMCVFMVFMLVMVLKPAVVHAEGMPIKLDGYFDDWVDKPYMNLKYDWENPGQIHTVYWYSDDDNLYLSIKMGTRGGQSLGNYIINYSVDGGKSGMLTLQQDNPSTGRISVFNYSENWRPLTTDGYVVRGDNSDGKTSDQCEFRIPLTEFTSKKGAIFNVTMGIPSLGPQALVFQAGSTKPYLGIAICISVSLLGVYIYSRKKRIRERKIA